MFERPRQTAGKVQAGGSRVVPMGDPENEVTTHRRQEPDTDQEPKRRGKNSKISRTKGPRSNAGRPKGTTPGQDDPPMQDARAQEGCAQLGCQTETHRSKGKKSWAVAGQTKGQQTTGPEVSQRERKAQKQ